MRATNLEKITPPAMAKKSGRGAGAAGPIRAAARGSRTPSSAATCAPRASCGGCATVSRRRGRGPSAACTFSSRLQSASASLRKSWTGNFVATSKKPRGGGAAAAAAHARTGASRITCIFFDSIKNRSRRAVIPCLAHPGGTSSQIQLCANAYNRLSMQAGLLKSARQY